MTGNVPIEQAGKGGAARGDEFFPSAAHWPPDLNRRDFLQVMGASLALAGLTGCVKRPLEKIVPYVVAPEKTPTADVAWYATVMPREGFARGVLAKSVLGRPIKLEGNPDHPESLGASDAVTQAAILSLYDPDRATTPRRAGQVAGWGVFEREWIARLPEFQRARGRGLAILTEPTTSPTHLRELHALLDAWPEAQWFQHTALARYDREGAQLDFDFAAADVILSLGSDCFHQHPAALRYVRAFSSRRRIEQGRTNLNRFYALESTLSLTGAMADSRLGLSPRRFSSVLNALAATIEGRSSSEGLEPREQAWVRDCAQALAGATKVGLCVAGEEMPDELHQWADTFNHRFGRTAVRRLRAQRSDGDARAWGGLAAMVTAADRGDISALWVLGTNPVYTAPGDVDVVAALRRVPFTVSLGEYADETAEHCTWQLPEAHFLETWSDLRAYSGAASIQQPLIEPRHAGRSIAESLRFLRTGEKVSAYDLVRETWRGGEETHFDSRWHEWLNRGVIDEPVDAVLPVSSAPSTADFPVLRGTGKGGETILLFRPDSNVLDGRWANNAWLQELPQPFTSLVWENAALISAELAKKLGLKNGDVIACELAGAALEAPVWILPGQAADCITLPLGYGRTRGGEIADGRGFSVYPLRVSMEAWQREGFSIRSAGRHQKLVTTQEHFNMEGRDLVRVVSSADLGKLPEETPTVASLFPSWPRDRYAWGMSIDLSTCFGCNACVVACQAENNIPVVGRDQVSRGREMHWIRIARYFSGKPANPRVLHQPIPCMHCENAPCEVVCPVGATVHSSEGVNDMVYNRCVGTRYCSNNCPYKVRRFNFLDYRAPAGSPVYQQVNPDVTVRERGVMEKCTYCVQRINAARIAAEKDNRRIRDGEVRTACQQACPAEAIVFGDLNDPASRVVQRKREKTSYRLLEELDTRPRTSYLAKILSDDRAHKEAAKA